MAEETKIPPSTAPGRREAGLMAGGSVITGMAALIGASCCVLPILLIHAGVSTVLVAQLGILASAKPYLLAITLALVLAAFVTAYWRGRRPHARVLALLVVATLLVAGAFAIPYVERDVLDWLGGP